ncbi:MAG: hypothetical protein SGJ24_03680 [Chloroflexota bacterium]|nr:hypothetical protein [Chloroflexota bacterium]
MYDPRQIPSIDPRIAQIAARCLRAGWGDALLTLLDVMAPFGAIGAGLLDVAQPAARLFGDRTGTISALARAIETPDGTAALRSYIEANDDSDPDAARLPKRG